MQPHGPPPATLSGPDSTGVDLAVAENGNTIAVWAESGIKASRLTFGTSTWSPEISIAPLALSQGLPSVDVDAVGNAVIAWQESDGSNVVIRATTLSLTNVVGTITTLSATGQNASNAQVAVDAAGNAIVVWQRSDGVNTIIQAATLIGGVWSAPIDLSAAGSNSISPKVEITPSGYAIVVWENSNGIQARTLTLGGALSPIMTIPTALGEDALNPEVAIDDAGNAIVVWRQTSGINVIIQSSFLTFGSPAFTAPINVSGTTGNNQLPKIAMDPSGNATAIWINSSGGVNTVQAASLPDGSTTWSAITNLTSFTGPAIATDIAMDEVGNAIAVWIHSTSPASRFVESSILPLGGTWEAPVAISGTSFSIDHAVVDAGPARYAVAAWDIGDPKFIQAAFLTIDLPPISIQGSVVKNKFLTGTEYFKTITWTPVSDPSIAYYQLFRNGSLIATISATGPFTFTECRSKRKSDVYTLIAYNAEGIPIAGSSIPI